MGSDQVAFQCLVDLSQWTLFEVEWKKFGQWAGAIKSSHAPPSFLIGRTTHTPKSFFIFVIYREPPKTREILAEKNKKLRIGGNLLINEMWNCVVEYQQQPNSLVDRPIRQETRAKLIHFFNSHNWVSFSSTLSHYKLPAGR